MGKCIYKSMRKEVELSSIGDSRQKVAGDATRSRRARASGVLGISEECDNSSKSTSSL